MKRTLFLVLSFLTSSLFAQERGVSPVKGGKGGETGETYAVVVGISDYQDEGIPDLRFAHKDAEAFANFLRSPAGGSLDGDHLKLLTNNQATGASVSIALDRLIEVAKEGDRVIIYFSGHGDVESKRISQPGYLLGWDAPAHVYMAGGAVNIRDLQDIVSTLSVQNKARVVVITDACRSGKLSGSEINGAQLTGQNLARQFSNEIKILSCQPDEYSIEGEQWGGGRGAFSYHLLDGLYGMADRNGDASVNLMEIRGYLEEKVSAEVDPQSQLPMVVGNGRERLTDVFPEILAQLKEGRKGQLQVITSTESRGIEDNVLAAADTNIVEMYFAFQKALEDKQFLFAESGRPENAYADFYYKKLIAESSLQRLHSIMRRNYAAALQDDAQQAINIWLQADASAVICLDRDLNAHKIATQLEKAAELLGKDHYMYKPLKSRQYLFEGKANKVHDYEDEELGQKTLSAYRKAASFEPQSPLPWFEMSKVFTTNIINTDSAFICAEKATELSPFWILPYADLAKGLVELKDTLAKNALLAAEEIDSLHPFVINRWGNYYAKITKESEKAIEQFEQFKNSGASLYPCWYHEYCLALMDFEKFDKAEAVLLEAIEEDPASQGIHSTITLLYITMGEWEKAEQSARKGIELDSTSGNAWSFLAFIYGSTGRKEESIPLWHKIIELEPFNVNYPFNLAFILWGLGRSEEAVEVCLNALELDPNKIDTYGILASSYQELGQFEKSEAAFIKAIQLDSTDEFFHFKIGQLYLKTRRYKEAEKYFKKAIQLDSTFTRAYNYLGNVYKDTRQYEEAEKYYKKAIQLDSTYGSAWGNLGFLYLKTNQPEKAEAAFLKTLQLNKNNPFPHPFAYVGLGALDLQNERFGEAEERFKKALELNPGYPDAHNSLGLLYIRTGRFDEAKSSLDKTLELDPENASARIYLAQWSLKMNQPEQAWQYLGEGLEKGYDDFKELQSESDFAAMRKEARWEELMQKYFPDQTKD